MKPILPLLTASLLLGCLHAPAPKPMPRPVGPIAVAPVPIANGPTLHEPDSCGAAELAGLVGQNEGMMRTVNLTGPTRTIPFGTLVTQEYNAARLNVYLDQTGTISRITCG
jgi:hypothetical protein